MLDIIKISKDTADTLLSLQESLVSVVETENNINSLIMAKCVDDVTELVQSFPELAYEKNIIEKSIGTTSSENDIAKKELFEFYKKRKAEIDRAVDDFTNSEIFKLYSEALILQQIYESKIKKHKKPGGVREHLSNELKNSLKNSVVEASFKLFIEPMTVEAINNNKVVISCSNEWARGIIESRFAYMIKQQLFNILGMEMEPVFIAR